MVRCRCSDDEGMTLQIAANLIDGEMCGRCTQERGHVSNGGNHRAEPNGTLAELMVTTACLFPSLISVSTLAEERLKRPQLLQASMYT